MTTAAIRKAVLAKFCAPEWATFLEVHNGTGSTQRRSADAIAMNLFPSRGLRLHGFEFKVSRGDWLRELKDPTKSDPIQRYCDHWWIVALPDIVRPDELPPTWGLYVLKGSGLHAIAKAPPLERRPIDPPFLAALLRRAHEFAGRNLDEEVRKRTAVAEARVEERVKREVETRTSKHEVLRQAVAEFEAASGIKIADGLWYSGSQEIGAAVKLVRQAGVMDTYSGAERLAKVAREVADRIETVMAAFRVAVSPDAEAAE
jgi:hypothetical protein